MTRSKRNARERRPPKTGRSDRWADVVHQVLKAFGGKATLKQLYAHLERHPRTEGADEVNWRAKVRQTIQADDRYIRTAPGTWAFADRYTPQQVASLRRLRRKRYPRRSLGKD